MELNKIEALPQKELIPGFKGRFIHTGTMTISYWNIASGAQLPLHSHIHEQVSQVIEGTLELTVENQTFVLKAGDVLTIAPNEKHSGKALEDCLVQDIFLPEREDYKF
jgi:quercetin dioxygenase-like cupin family protein